MTICIRILAAASFLGVLFAGCTPVEARIKEVKEMNLVWSEEFDGEAVDDGKWTFETGTGAGGWGNNELQYYRKENAEIRELPAESGKALVITAREEPFGGKGYTSARLKTQGKFSFTYGKIEARMRLPEGQGIWPAFWMLGESITPEGWPKCGEIDIMEMVGGAGDNTVHGTLHWYGVSGREYFGRSKTFSAKLSSGFRVYGLEWDTAMIRWYVDGEEFHRQDIRSGVMTEFHKPFFLLLNLAVGGNWPGSPDKSTAFPQEYWIDWIRVYQ